MKRQHRGTTPNHQRKRAYRKLSGPEQVEARCLMDGALPLLMADAFTGRTNSDPQLLNVLGNDAWNAYLGARQITAVSFPTAGGVVDISGDGKSVLFRPSADFSGDDTFSYVVDGLFTATVTVHVVSPLAADAFTVYPDGQPRTLDLLANDPFWANYVGEKKITFLSATQLGGTVSIGTDRRTVTYVAPDDPATLGETDHFSYIVDGKYSAVASLSLFNPLRPYVINLPQNSEPIQLAPLDRSNFAPWVGYGGAKLITKIVESSTGSTVSVNPDGRTISYRPAHDFIGSETITYVVDGKFSSTITLSVGEVVQPDSYVIDENDPGTVLSVLANDVYAGFGQPPTQIATQITSVAQPNRGGHVEIVPGGQGIRYTPAPGFVGDETFVYQASGRYTTTVTVSVSRPVRDDYGSSLNTLVLAESQGNVLDVLRNDFQKPGAHTITAVGSTSHGGTVTIRSDGLALIYTPRPDFFGLERFTYTVDGQWTATVEVNVESPASTISKYLAPVSGHTYRIELTPLARGISQYAGAGVVTAISVVSGNVTASISADGQAVLFTSGNFGSAVIAYTLDGKYSSQVYVQFNPSRFLGASNTIVEQNQSARINVLANAPWVYSFQSYEGARLVTEVFGSQHGTVSIADDGSVIYVPNDDYEGSDSFRYFVDGHELGTATVQVIRRVRDDQFRVDTSSQANVLAVELNDQLGSGYTGIGRITQVGAALHGTAAISVDGRSLIYTPTVGYSGADNFTYLVDGHLKATVEVTVSNAAESLYPQFSGLAELQEWLIQNAIARYSNYFGKLSLEAILVDPVFRVFTTNADSLSTASHSTTNVQVEGVDEADLTEADSNFLYVVSGGKLVISRAAGSQLSIASQTTFDGTPVGIYLSGDRLTVISRSGGNYFRPSGIQIGLPGYYWGRQETTVTVFDVTDREHPQMLQKSVFDGAQVDTRKVGDFVYLVLNNTDLVLPAPLAMPSPNTFLPYPVPTYYETQEVYVARIREHFGTVLESILPHFRSYGPDGNLVRSGVLLLPEEIGKPLDPTNQSLLSIVTINTAGNEPGFVAATGVLSASAAQLYMNHDSIYVLRTSNTGTDGSNTDILKFTLDETTGDVTPAAHGQVPGVILNQFSMDEVDGNLRIATTVSNAFSGTFSSLAENDVWVLRQDGNLLELIGSLQNLAPGESIRSVRFDGHRAVITTFPTNQSGIDPVYMVDLTEPTQPRYVGALTLPGFNQYMHFIDDTHVLTVGVNAPAVPGAIGLGNGAPLQVSLFDVSDFAHPVLLDQYTLARFSNSLAQQDHHAFGWFADSGLLALPIAHTYTQLTDLDGDGYRETRTVVQGDEVQYFHIQTTGPGRGVQLVGSVALGAPALRSAFIGDTLYAIGDGRIVASSMQDPGTPLASVSWNVLPSGNFFPIDFGPVRLIELPLDPTPHVPTFEELVEGFEAAARSDLAERLGVSAASALLIAVEAPEALPGGGVNTTGTRLIFRSGQRNLLYEVTSTGTVELVDADFQFPAETRVPDGSEPILDVNQDQRVSPRDALMIINDLLQHNGSHEGEARVLRKTTRDTTFSAFDVNHDGVVSPRDLLLIVNALLQEQENSLQQPLAAVPLAATESESPVVEGTAGGQQITSGLSYWQTAPTSHALMQGSEGNSPARKHRFGDFSLSQMQLLLTVPFTSRGEIRNDTALAATEEWSPLAELSLLDDLSSTRPPG